MSLVQTLTYESDTSVCESKLIRLSRIGLCHAETKEPNVHQVCVELSANQPASGGPTPNGSAAALVVPPALTSIVTASAVTPMRTRRHRPVSFECSTIYGSDFFGGGGGGGRVDAIRSSTYLSGAVKEWVVG